MGSSESSAENKNSSGLVSGCQKSSSSLRAASVLLMFSMDV